MANNHLRLRIGDRVIKIRLMVSSWWLSPRRKRYSREPQQREDHRSA
jgi:hypothetical protein